MTKGLERADDERGEKAVLQAARMIAAKWHSLYQRKRDAAARLRGEAHQLIREWDQLITDYTRLLRSLAPDDLERDPAFFRVRGALAAVAQKLQEDQAIGALLNEPGAEAEFGLAEPNLVRLLKSPMPEQALAAMLDALEKATRTARQAKDPVSPDLREKRPSDRSDGRA